MLRELSVASQSWPLATPFRISRGVKTVAEVVVVEVHQGCARGRGEGVPYPRYGETVDSVLEQVGSVKKAIAEGMTREALQGALPPGAARNAVDCALWDLSAGTSGQSVTAQLGAGPLPALTTALTIGIDTPEAMRSAAERLSAHPLIKVKVDNSDPEGQLRAVLGGCFVALLVEDRVELGRAHPVGHEGAHHRARAGPHVEIEVVGAEAGQLVESGERAHLVHPADDPAPGQGERVTGPGRAALPEPHGAMHDLH